MKKGEIDDEVNAAKQAIDTLGGQLRGIKRVSLGEFEKEKRALVVVDKINHTPQRYPRRPGIPQKRPL